MNGLNIIITNWLTVIELMVCYFLASFNSNRVYWFRYRCYYFFFFLFFFWLLCYKWTHRRINRRRKKFEILALYYLNNGLLRVKLTSTIGGKRSRRNDHCQIYIRSYRISGECVLLFDDSWWQWLFLDFSHFDTQHWRRRPHHEYISIQTLSERVVNAVYFFAVSFLAIVVLNE